MKRTTQHRLLSLARPDATPLAGLFLMASCFSLLIGTLQEPVQGIVLLGQTPHLPYNVCFNVADPNRIAVCLTANGRLSFSVSEPSLQEAVLEQVGKEYGVHFSTNDLASLKSTAFVAVRLERLPATLAAASHAPAHQQADSSSALTQAQLLDCIETARMLSPTLTQLPTAIYLSISAQTKASLVMHLLKQFQQRKLNQLYLLNHCYS